MRRDIKYLGELVSKIPGVYRNHGSNIPSGKRTKEVDLLIACWTSIIVAFLLLIGIQVNAQVVTINTAGQSLSSINQAWNNAGLIGSFVSSVNGGITTDPNGIKVAPVYNNNHWVNMLSLTSACFGNQDISVRIRVRVESFTNLYGAHNMIQVLNRSDVNQSPSFQHQRSFTGGALAQNTRAWAEVVNLNPLTRVFHDVGPAPSPVFELESEYNAITRVFTSSWYDNNGNILFSHSEPEVLGGGTLTNIIGVVGFFSHQPPNIGTEANPNTAGPNDGAVISRIDIESPCLPKLVLFPDVDDIAQTYADNITDILNNITTLLGGNCNDNKLNQAHSKLQQALSDLALVVSDCSFDDHVKDAMNAVKIAINLLGNVGCPSSSIQKDLSDATREALSDWIDLAAERVGGTDQRVLDAAADMANGDSKLPNYQQAVINFQHASNQLINIFEGPCQ